MSSWWQLWQLREKRAAEVLLLDQVLANHVEDEERHEIEDLADPRGKRFLFEPGKGMPQQSTSAEEATPAPANRPLLSSLTWRTHADMCELVPTCVRTCRTCALLCSLQHGRKCEHRA